MNIFRSLFLVFLIIPIIEIYLLIKVGGIIGAIPTILLIIATAAIGAFLLRMQGIATVNRVQSTLQRGEIPAIEMMEGLLLLISGALLLTPGFFTDAIGFLALVPPLRQKFIVWGLKHMNVVQMQQHTHQTYEGHARRERDHITIEGEYKKEKD